jgi:hypothetical protein
VRAISFVNLSIFYLENAEHFQLFQRAKKGQPEIRLTLRQSM